MLRIGICDDECYARDALRLELEKLLEETEEIVYEFSCGETAVSWLKKHPGEIDLLFLDVEMKGVNGIRTAEQIREFDTRIQIVFVTGFRDFVFEGYRVQAVDYLVKPVDADRLSSVLSRVRRQLEQVRQKQFVFQNGDGVYRLYQDEIQYFYSEKRKVVAVTREKELSFYAKLDEVEARVGRTFVPDPSALPCQCRCGVLYRRIFGADRKRGTADQPGAEAGCGCSACESHDRW